MLKEDVVLNALWSGSDVFGAVMPDRSIDEWHISRSAQSVWPIFASENLLVVSKRRAGIPSVAGCTFVANTQHCTFHTDLLNVAMLRCMLR